MDSAQAARRHEADPGPSCRRRACRRRSSPRRRAGRRRRRRRAGRSCARPRRTAPSSRRVRPTTTSPSRIPIVAGVAPALADGASPSGADVDALAGREPVRDERRLERDDAAAVGSSARATSSARRITASLRARAAACGGLEPERGTRRRGSPRRARRRRRWCRRARRHGRKALALDDDAAAAALHDPAWPRRGRVRSRSRSFAKTTSGASARTRDAERRRRQRPRREVERDLCAGGASELAPPAAPRTRSARDAARSPTRGAASQSEPRRLELVGESSGAAPRSETIVRSPAAAIATTTPLRPSAGPATSTPRPRSSARDELPCRVAAALRDEARLCAERRGPRGDVRGLPAGADARRRRRGRRRATSGRRGWTITSRSRSPSVSQPHRTMLVMDGEDGASRRRADPLVRARRGRRRRRRDRRRTPATPRSRRPRDAPAGLAAFEDAPCFLEVVEREAQRYREGGRRDDDRPVERRVDGRS